MIRATMRVMFPIASLILLMSSRLAGAEPLRVGVFAVDASPPVGSPMAYDPVKGVQTPLSCRGIVLLGADAPIVLCAIDWIALSNDGHRLFRDALAKAAMTDPSRVAVHALHQHDAPRCDFSAESLMSALGHPGVGFDPTFARDVMRRAAEAVKTAIMQAQPVTQLGLGSGVVEQVASNRRILGPDGKVAHVRYSATKDPAVRAYPEGVIDPELKLITFYAAAEQPLAVLTYYATHPQSYYRTGLANPDFPGLARDARQQTTGVPHVHFNGASGNITAGKYNDGAPENRQVLADRMARGMQRAWDEQRRIPIAAGDVAWNVVATALSPAVHLDEPTLTAKLRDETLDPKARFHDATRLSWLRRCARGETIDIGCLTLGPARVLHLPGELFIEYQLAAQRLRPDLFIATAAYGDCAPFYIGTEVAYAEGGYETEPRSSNVSPRVEEALMRAIEALLEQP